MANQGFLRLTGDKALEKALKKLPERVQRKVARQAINAGATPVLKAARAKVPVDEGLLKKSLGKKVKTYKPFTVMAIIGPRRNITGADGVDAFYAHMVEFGTEHSAAQPFLRPAFDETRDQQLDAIRKKLGQGVEREALKLAKG